MRKGFLVHVEALLVAAGTSAPSRDALLA